MFSRIKAIVLEHLYRLRRSPDEWVDSFFWSTIDIIIWGFMTLYFAQLGGTSAKIGGFLLSGMILWNIVWRPQQDIAVSLLTDVWNQNLLNLFASPLSPREYIIATFILGFIKIFLTLGIVCTLSIFLYAFNIFKLGFYLIPVFFILILFGWAMGVIIIGLIIRYGQRVQFLAWTILALLNPVNCVYYPLATLPKGLQTIAVFFPPTYIFEAMRMILKGKTPPNEYFIIAFILGLCWLIISGVIFNFFFGLARRTGRLARVEG